MQNKKMTKKERNDFVVKNVKEGLQNIKKEDLREIITTVLNETYKKSATNLDLVTLINKKCEGRKTEYLKIYETYKYKYFGVNIYEISNTFNINNYKRKQLEKYELLIVNYTYETRAYGGYLDVPVYDIDSVISLLEEDLDLLLKEARKKTRKQKKEA